MLKFTLKLKLNALNYMYVKICKRPNTTKGWDEKCHLLDSIIGIDGKYHHPTSRLGIDGKYHHSSWKLGFDGKYHPVQV